MSIRYPAVHGSGSGGHAFQHFMKGFEADLCEGMMTPNETEPKSEPCRVDSQHSDGLSAIARSPNYSFPLFWHPYRLALFWADIVDFHFTFYRSRLLTQTTV
jgi:hypothetical protein